MLDNQVYSFSKALELAEKLAISPSTLSFWLSLPDQPVLPGYIQLKWGYDPSGWRKVKDMYSELDLFTKQRSVKVIEDSTKRYRIFSSAKECADVMNLKPTTLNYRLKSEGKKVFEDGFSYCYYSDKIQKNGPICQ